MTKYSGLSCGPANVKVHFQFKIFHRRESHCSAFSLVHMFVLKWGACIISDLHICDCLTVFLVHSADAAVLEQ